MEILKFPDPRLRIKAQPVAKVDADLAKLADDMLETMYEARGIGLAATQVGVAKRLLVIDTRPRDIEGRYDLQELSPLEQQVVQPIVIFNPEVVAKEGDTIFSEGCLSVPGYYEEVKRCNWVEVQGLDRQGRKLVIKTDGLLAICLQHEIDHLDGKLFIDRLSTLKSTRIKNKIRKHGYPDRDSDDESESEEVL